MEAECDESGCGAEAEQGSTKCVRCNLPPDFDPDEPVVTMNWTMADIRSMAAEHDPPIPLTLAMDRAREWGKYIEESVSGSAGEQLSNVVTVGQP